MAPFFVCAYSQRVEYRRGVCECNEAHHTDTNTGDSRSLRTAEWKWVRAREPYITNAVRSLVSLSLSLFWSLFAILDYIALIQFGWMSIFAFFMFFFYLAKFQKNFATFETFILTTRIIIVIEKIVYSRNTLNKYNQKWNISLWVLKFVIHTTKPFIAPLLKKITMKYLAPSKV